MSDHTKAATTNAARPGWKTTELYVTLAGLCVSALLATGVITPGQATVVNEHVQTWAAIATPLIAVGYALARAITKHGLTVGQRLTAAEQAVGALAGLGSAGGAADYPPEPPMPTNPPLTS